MDKMLEVKVIGQDHEGALEGHPIQLVENGVSYEALEILRDDENFTEAPPLAEDDYESIRFETDDIFIAFAKCGQGLLHNTLVDVYYIADMRDPELGDKLFIVQREEE